MIQLSRILVELNQEDVVLDIIRHELAHALIDRKHAHNSVWIAKARSLGYLGDRVCKKAISPRGKYEAVCSTCKHVFPAFRKPKRNLACGFCCKKNGDRFSYAFLLKYEEVF